MDPECRRVCIPGLSTMLFVPWVGIYASTIHMPTWGRVLWAHIVAIHPPIQFSSLYFPLLTTPLPLSWSYTRTMGRCYRKVYLGNHAAFTDTTGPLPFRGGEDPNFRLAATLRSGTRWENLWDSGEGSRSPRARFITRLDAGALDT